MSKGPTPTSIVHRRSVVDSLPSSPPEAEDPCAGPFTGFLDGDHGSVGTILYLIIHDGRYGAVGEGGFAPVHLAELYEARMSACGRRGWAFSAVVTGFRDGSTELAITGSPPA